MGTDPAASNASPAPTTLPLLGSRPLRTSIEVQREADNSAGVDSAPMAQASTWPPGHTPAPALGPVPFTWVPSTDLPDTVTARPTPGAAQATVALQRIPEPGASTAAPVSVSMREITFPAAGLPSLTAGDPFAGPGLPGPATVGGVPAASGAPVPVQRLGPPVASAASTRSGPSVARRAGAAAAGAPLALVRPHLAAAAESVNAAQAAASGARVTADAPAPTVQSSPASAAATVGTSTQLPTFTATPIVQRVDGAAPSGGDEKAGHTDTELDELAKAIFGRISNRLRTEVIHEREAKGLTFDAF